MLVILLPCFLITTLHSLSFIFCAVIRLNWMIAAIVFFQLNFIIKRIYNLSVGVHLTG